MCSLILFFFLLLDLIEEFRHIRNSTPRRFIKLFSEYGPVVFIQSEQQRERERVDSKERKRTTMKRSPRVTLFPSIVATDGRKNPQTHIKPQQKSTQAVGDMRTSVSRDNIQARSSRPPTSQGEHTMQRTTKTTTSEWQQQQTQHHHQDQKDSQNLNRQATVLNRPDLSTKHNQNNSRREQLTFVHDAAVQHQRQRQHEDQESQISRTYYQQQQIEHFSDPKKREDKVSSSMIRRTKSVQNLRMSASTGGEHGGAKEARMSSDFGARSSKQVGNPMAVRDNRRPASFEEGNREVALS